MATLTHRMGIDEILLRHQIILHVGAFWGWSHRPSHWPPHWPTKEPHGGPGMHERRVLLHVLRWHSVKGRGRVEGHHTMVRGVHHGASLGRLKFYGGGRGERKGL